MNNNLGLLLRNALNMNKGKPSSESFVRELKQGERRKITVLFLDLSGFTAFSEILDHEIVHEIIGSVMERLASIVIEYSGYVDKIEGDRIMALFGAKNASENDSTRAISCSQKMLEAIQISDDILSSAGFEISARVGINTGMVTVAPDAIGHLTAMGSTVNLASRLEENAQANIVFVSDEVRRECSDKFNWKDQGEVFLKGISNPVQVWTPLSSTKKSNNSNFKSSEFFIGRDRELSVLINCLEYNALTKSSFSMYNSTQHIIVGIDGEAGIGKSALVYEFEKHCRLHGEEVTVLKGFALSYAQPQYWLWRSVICDALGIEQKQQIQYDEFKEVLNSFAGTELADSAPFIAELLSIESNDPRLDQLDDRSIALETHIAFRDFVRAKSEDSRVVLFLDDIQYMDRTCFETLKFILENCETRIPIICILVCRHTHEHQLNDEIEKGIELSLSFIEDDIASKILRSILSGFAAKESSVDEQVEEFVIAHAHGNPLFIKNLITDLVETGKVLLINDVWVFAAQIQDIYVPKSLIGLLQSRLDNLPSNWKQALQYASVLGTDFYLSVFQKLIDSLDLREISSLDLDALTRIGYLRKLNSKNTSKFRFRHVLIHDAAYQTILDRNLELLHRIAGEIIEEDLLYEDERKHLMLFKHFKKAQEYSKAIEWGLKVAQNFERTCRYNEGLRVLNEISGWCDNIQKKDVCIRRKIELLKLKSRLKGELGDWAEAHSTIENSLALACSTGDEKLILGSKIYLVTSLVRSGEFDKASTLMEEMYKYPNISKYPEIYTKLLRNRGIVFWRQNKHEDAIKYFSMNIEYIEENSDDLQKAISLGNLAMAEAGKGNLNRAIELTESKLAICEELDNQKEIGISLGNLGSYYGMKSDLKKARNYFEREYNLYNKLKRKEGLLSSLANLGTLARMENRNQDSIEYYLKALKIAKYMGNRPSIAHIEGNIGSIYRELGKQDLAFRHTLIALNLSRKLSDEYLTGLNHRRLAIYYSDSGDTESASTHYKSSIENFALAVDFSEVLETASLLARFYHDNGNYSDAAELCNDMIKKHGSNSDYSAQIDYLLRILQEIDKIK
ncbi:MAG: tetratricopeptide repeat protein [Candidatus Cloacimonetes bacterium]|nr:tetratricopeptide repeat protein [Candidatus Cloacimonadota bacterium]